MKILIFGGTGALGNALVHECNIRGHDVVVASRDEAKHHKMYEKGLIDPQDSIICDIRNYDSVLRAIRISEPDVIINAAALKHVPFCEQFPFEAVQTNVVGTQNLVRAVEELKFEGAVISVSTDKAVNPINVYGMTKAIQEHIHLGGRSYTASFIVVRYGNVLTSTGSVIPVFQERIKNGLPLKVTSSEMTRFFLSLEDAVQLIFSTISYWSSFGWQFNGTICVPSVKSGYIMDLAELMLEHLPKDERRIEFSGIRPGEKLHEVLISEEELKKTKKLMAFYQINKFDENSKPIDLSNYSSGNPEFLMTKDELRSFLVEKGVL